jgi:hypothetical protein
MVPTLAGRIQTRVFLLATVGVVLTVLITPVLPVSTTLGQTYRTTFSILVSVAVLGIGWEFIYHGLQQFRWEKDWPTMFGLLTGINEGLLLWALITAGVIPNADGTPGAAFVVHFAVVWVGVWLFANGPMRVPFIRWRFQGGRLL